MKSYNLGLILLALFFIVVTVAYFTIKVDNKIIDYNMKCKEAGGVVVRNADVTYCFTKPKMWGEL